MTRQLMQAVVLADNDIIQKLACCGLLRELLQWLKVPPAEVWVLPSMRFMLRRKLKNNLLALAEVEWFLKQVSDIPEADVTRLAALPAEMDVGERQMLAVLVDTPAVANLITGDKRALRLIGSLCANDPALLQRLTDARVDCLESVMLGLIDALGFEAVNQKVLQGLASDTVLKASFGLKKLERDAKATLRYYLDDVRKDASFLRG
jgi:hypothetical protein